MHNTRWWSTTNPHIIAETHFQETWSVNIWAGIIGNEIVEPRLFPNTLNGADYLNFLREDLRVLLEGICLA